MKKKTRILIADDHAFLRMGLSSFLASVSDMECIGEAANGNSAVELARKLKPEVIIMDLMMPDISGAEATRIIHKEMPEIKIIILTTFGTSQELSRAVDNGAVGAILKDADMEEFIETIRKVSAGATIPSWPSRCGKSGYNLSSRQQEMLSAITKGLSNGEIGQIFGISGVTVKKHLTVVFKKIGAANRSEAIAIAVREQLV